jgi:hypothetical protein
VPLNRILMASQIHIEYISLFFFGPNLTRVSTHFDLSAQLRSHGQREDEVTALAAYDLSPIERASGVEKPSPCPDKPLHSPIVLPSNPAYQLHGQ